MTNVAEGRVTGMTRSRASASRMIRFQLAMLESAERAGTIDWAADVRERDPVLTAAELAPCTCPEFCERDHELD